MRQTKDIKLFGEMYRLWQLSAADAFQYISTTRDPKVELMSLIGESAIYTGAAWCRLGEEVIDERVKDRLGVMQPRLVLKALVKQLNDFNFGFLAKRQTFKVPGYLRTEHSYEIRQIEGESPVLGVLVAEGKATLRELQEYYSLEDAFRIYDILFVEKLNAAEAHHEIYKNIRSKNAH